MKNLIYSFCIGLFLILTGTESIFAQSPISKAVTAEKQSSLTPQRVLEMLREGNQRFIKDNLRSYNYRKEMKVTSSQGQFPIAIILNCMDSRSIADILFDQGLGNLFVARVAGNVVDTNMLGSMEFATAHAGVPLIVVMGHTHCGAVRGACAGGASGNLKRLLNNIQPAVKKIIHGDNSAKACENPETIDAIAKQNVINQMSMILKNSSTLAQMVKEHKVMLAGAMHDIRTGKVVFFDINGNEA